MIINQDKAILFLLEHLYKDGIQNLSGHVPYSFTEWLLVNGIIEKEPPSNNVIPFLSKKTREDYFLKQVVPQIQWKFNVEKKGPGFYQIFTDDLGTLNYYPKADKVQVHKGAKWHEEGLKWIFKHLIKEEL